MAAQYGSFRYLADPACIISLIIYPINRFELKPHHIGGWFTHGYLNDVLCLPLFVPMILYAQHLVGLRPHRRYPNLWELFQNWAAFTVMFQVIIPRFPKTYISAGDPWDILAYLAGGIIAGTYWSMAARKGEKSLGSCAEAGRAIAQFPAGHGSRTTIDRTEKTARFRVPAKSD